MMHTTPIFTPHSLSVYNRNQMIILVDGVEGSPRAAARTSPGRLAERDARCLPRGSFLKTYATTGAYPWGFRPLS